MKDLVSNRRVGILAGAASSSILGALFVVPFGLPWTGLLGLGALAFLLVSSVVLGVEPAPSLAPIAMAAAGQTARRKS